MADLGGVFDASVGDFLPDRLMLREEGFKGAFQAFRTREEADGRKATLETLCDDVGINERVLRAARAGEKTLPRHQVLKLADCMGCTVADIVRMPDEAARRARVERDRRELAAWPVPLRGVQSWTGFVKLLTNANVIRPLWRDDVLDLVAAPIIDSFRRTLAYADRVARENPATAAAALKDAAEDLRAHGLHVLEGRYVGRVGASDDEPVRVHLSLVLEVWIRREAEDPGHVVDRSREPMTISDEEDFFFDDGELPERWLAWEGKRQLALWG